MLSCSCVRSSITCSVFILYRTTTGQAKPGMADQIGRQAARSCVPQEPLSAESTRGLHSDHPVRSAALGALWSGVLCRWCCAGAWVLCWDALGAVLYVLLPRVQTDRGFVSSLRRLSSLSSSLLVSLLSSPLPPSYLPPPISPLRHVSWRAVNYSPPLHTTQPATKASGRDTIARSVTMCTAALWGLNWG